MAIHCFAYMAEYPDNKYSSCSYIEPILAVSDLAQLASSREVKLKGESRMSATCTYFRIVIKKTIQLWILVEILTI